MTRVTTILLFTFCIASCCYAQKGDSKKITPPIYSNFISINYFNCLKTGLPCQCEKLNEYFLISIDTTSKIVLLYDGRTNYDYNLYDYKIISPASFRVYNVQYPQTLFRDTTTVIGQIKIDNDTLLFIDASGSHTKFIPYSIGDNDSYFKEHIKLLNAAFTARGYDSLNKILQSDSLECWCNWELGGINSIFGNQQWILEKKHNQLYIYEWTNPPHEKQLDIKIKKKLLKKLKW